MNDVYKVEVPDTETVVLLVVSSGLVVVGWLYVNYVQLQLKLNLGARSRRDGPGLGQR
jgi:hypothetical protein